jgi:hypothetical protein
VSEILEKYSVPFVPPVDDGVPWRCSMMLRLETWPYAQVCKEDATRTLKPEVFAWVGLWFNGLYLNRVCDRHAEEICQAYEQDQGQ